MSIEKLEFYPVNAIHELLKLACVVMIKNSEGKHNILEVELCSNSICDFRINLPDLCLHSCRYCQIGNAVAVPVARALGYALGLAVQKLSGDEPLLTLPDKFSHSTTTQLLQAASVSDP